MAEALLLFCFRSCLKEDNSSREYYDRLGLDSKASTDAIKKAYKKKSLQLHPDRLAQKGIQVTPEHNLEFQKLKEAYDVLADARKRRIYDQVGAYGLKLIDSPQEVNPMELMKNFQKNRSDRMKIAAVVVLVFAILLLLPILFCLKCDGKLDNAPWLAIWTPMWVLDAIMVISAVLFLVVKDEPPEDEEGEKPEEVSLSVKLFFAARTFTFVLIQIFVLMRLDHAVDWSWYRVFVPWFVYEFLALCDEVPVALVPVPPVDLTAIQTLEEDPEGMDQEAKVQALMIETEHFRKLLEQAISRKSMVVSVLRIWLALFLAAQLDGRVEWDWGLVLLPVWMYFVAEIVNSWLMRRWGASMLEGLDLEAALEKGEFDDPAQMMKAQHGQELLAAGSTVCCTLAFPVFIAVLLVCRLEAATFSTFIILIPVFLVLGCCCCGVGCGLCFFSSVDLDQFEGSEVGSDDPTAHMVRKDGRDENQYVPPNVDDVEATGNSAEYGTFSDSGKALAEPDLSTKESKPTYAAAVVSESNVDVDID
mmetsp:Transcript_23883/g.35039  ORF Transcript_23883/g.35039 Transcript_23883/m.35039 type:complete len:532 (+) Transcript_23883:59-1654(+)